MRRVKAAATSHNKTKMSPKAEKTTKKVEAMTTRGEIIITIVVAAADDETTTTMTMNRAMQMTRAADDVIATDEPLIA